ncbi:hypothetical protein MHA02_05080 [Methylobacterium haplocladii]|uniref:Uncharacterized protein n=1 Tax=Methylobacterium haplocladii TaxID=1176176 RepID=A0A512IK73_9HYPH|nr:hypothetical protein MHA02_05080 [Methylobacterium haplocladii]
MRQPVDGHEAGDEAAEADDAGKDQGTQDTQRTTLDDCWPDTERNRGCRSLWAACTARLRAT